VFAVASVDALLVTILSAEEERKSQVEKKKGQRERERERERATYFVCFCCEDSRRDLEEAYFSPYAAAGSSPSSCFFFSVVFRTE
jgi:hypothetical protein